MAIKIRRLVARPPRHRLAVDVPGAIRDRLSYQNVGAGHSTRLRGAARSPGFWAGGQRSGPGFDRFAIGGW